MTPSSSVALHRSILDGGIVALDARLKHARVSKYEDSRCANEPEYSVDWGRPPEQRDSDDEETCIQVFLRNGMFAKLGCLWSKFINCGEAEDQKCDGEEQQVVRYDCVHREGGDDEPIV